MRDRSYFIINTILVQTILIIVVNQQIRVLEDINLLKGYLPIIDLLVVVLGIFSVLSINEVNKIAVKKVEVNLIKNHLDQVKELVGALQESRHEYARHIQTIQSMLNLGKFDKAVEYIEGISERFYPAGDMVYVGHPVLTALLNSKNKAAELKGIEFAFCSKCDLKDIPVKPWDLCSMVGNLLDNAFEAVMHNKGPKRVGFEVKYEKGNYVIYVYNNGPSISPGLKQEIFKPGFTTKGSPARGYGLFFVKRLVEEYGGSIKVVSGEKTTFKVYLPGKGELENDKGCIREYSQETGRRASMR